MTEYENPVFMATRVFGGSEVAASIALDASTILDACGSAVVVHVAAE